MNISECLECPKCNKKFMKKSSGKIEFGKGYFCHYCHIYFGLNELVNVWGYDAGDLFANSGLVCPQPCTNYKDWLILPQSALDKLAKIEKLAHPIQTLHTDPVVETLYSINWFDTESVSTFLNDEPVWKTEAQKQEAYEIVTRMFLGIPEYEEGCGNQGIDIGLEGYPV